MGGFCVYCFVLQRAVIVFQKAIRSINTRQSLLQLWIESQIQYSTVLQTKTEKLSIQAKKVLLIPLVLGTSTSRFLCIQEPSKWNCFHFLFAGPHIRGSKNGIEAATTQANPFKFDFSAPTKIVMHGHTFHPQQQQNIQISCWKRWKQYRSNSKLFSCYNNSLLCYA